MTTTPALAAGPRSLLRGALWFDALSVAGLGLLLVLLAGVLEPWLGLEAGFLRTVGLLILLPFAAILAWTASRTPIPHPAVRWIVALNALYVLASFAILLFAWVRPTALGMAFVILQASIGGAVAAVEWVALMRERGAR